MLKTFDHNASLWWIGLARGIRPAILDMGQKNIEKAIRRRGRVCMSVKVPFFLDHHGDPKGIFLDGIWHDEYTHMYMYMYLYMYMYMYMFDDAMLKFDFLFTRSFSSMVNSLDHKLTQWQMLSCKSMSSTTLINLFSSHGIVWQFLLGY